MKKISRALISVSDKNQLSSIVKVLKKYNIEIISSGGTFKYIKKIGVSCKEISSFTGHNEMLDGRVKTLNSKIHAGILNIRNNKKHQREMKINRYEDIDLVIVNFYPFKNIIKKTNNNKTIIENIDIGGPAMVRSAAKNFEKVTVITDISYYQEFIQEISKNNGATSLNFRKKMASEAFMRTADYDATVSSFFNKKIKRKFPKKIIVSAYLQEKLRYGENPHQDAAVYNMGDETEISKISGKELSYNNYNDIYAALDLSLSLPKNKGTVIVKHGNPCGVSINNDCINSYEEAFGCDPISAFGGIVSLNFKLNTNLAIKLSRVFFEVIVAKGFSQSALKILKKKKNLRILDSSYIKNNNDNEIKSNFNSLLLQNKDKILMDKKNFQAVSKIKPSKKTMESLIFAFNVCRNVKSNAIVLANNFKTVGIGSGQPSRLDSCKIAIEKMRKFQTFNNNEQLIAASDAFFPFVDGMETLVQAGVSAVIQPYGSIRDKEIIKFANETNTILVFSKTRHFKH